MTVGKYAGTPIDQLPHSYLRWMMTQKFPKELLEVVEKKLKASDYNDLHLAVSRHALDMYSKRFLFRWMKSEHVRDGLGREGDGIATHVAKEAEVAWTEGVDVSKHRHQDDGIVKLYDGVLFVFKVNPAFPDYRDLVTVMDSTDQ